MLFVLPLFALLQIDAPNALLQWIDRIGQAQLDRRDAVIAGIRTREQAEARQQQVRAKILDLIGGLPDYNGPLNPRLTGSIDAGAYTIDKVVFESLPGYYVTANLYLPKSQGKHPAVLLPLGHWEQGKPAAQQIAGNLALKDFVVLAYDPMGQGERLQAYSPLLGASLAGGSVLQHLQAGAQSHLIGESYARYHIWDARRALDYLVSRPEVDPNRIGCTGCSGGGTITTYISALDPRIKVAAPACYMNSWRKLLSGPTGDAEQTIAGFLSSGLDLTDWVELFAPKPWLMASTEDDFFTPAGAKIAYDEARRFYAVFGDEERVSWIVGPGGHGTPKPVREAIYGWMIKWLADARGTATEENVQMRPDFEFQVTKSGQVSTDFQATEVHRFIEERYRALKSNESPVAFLRDRIGKRPLIPQLGGSTGEIRIPVDTGLVLTAKISVPPGSVRVPATLLVGRSREIDQTAAERENAGEVVMRLDPRGTPFPAPRELAGDWITNARAMAVGVNLPAMRARDILSGLDVLFGNERVDSAKVRVAAVDVAGIWAIYAAAADTRAWDLEVIRTPIDLESALRSPINRGLYEVVIPGLLLRGDLSSITGSRKVVWRDPVNWMRNVVPNRPGAVYSTFGH